MSAYFPKPSGENAGPTYLRFAELFSSADGQDNDKQMDLAARKKFSTLSVEELEQLEQFFKRTDSAMKTLEQASHLPVC